MYCTVLRTTGISLYYTVHMRQRMPVLLTLNL